MELSALEESVLFRSGTLNFGLCGPWYNRVMGQAVVFGMGASTFVALPYLIVALP